MRNWIAWACALMLGLAPMALAQDSREDLERLLAEAARTATALEGNEQAREIIEMQATEMVHRGESLQNDIAILQNEITRFNTDCPGTFDLSDPRYNRCSTWRSGLAQQQNVLLDNGRRLDGDIQALRGRDADRVSAGTALLTTLLRTLTAIDMTCAVLPASSPALARCRNLSFSPRLQAMAGQLQTLATQRSRECLRYPEPEQVSACANVAWDLSIFDPARPVPWVPLGFAVGRN